MDSIVKEISNIVSVDPQVCHGKTVFKGTRITVSQIQELVENGLSYVEILKGYPTLPKNFAQALKK